MNQKAPAWLYTWDEAWLARHQEEVIEPGLPIVDPHHHLWDHPHSRYMLPELLADIGGGHDVRATVYVECRSMYRADAPPARAPVGETEFVNGVAAMSASGQYGPARACAAIVGHADLTLGSAVREVLEAHVGAGGGRFRGIRHSSAWDAHPDVRFTTRGPARGLLLDARFREGFACLAPLGLSFDAWLYHTQIDELTDLARAFPDTTIVLDHVGGPLGIGPYAGRRDEVFAAWSASIAALARQPNVRVKLGGFGMRLYGLGFCDRPAPPSSEEIAQAWRPYFDTCVGAFGPKRSMCESNFPVDKMSCSYTVLWNAFKRLAAGASGDEKAALFSRTAAEAYRLPEYASL